MKRIAVVCGLLAGMASVAHGQMPAGATGSSMGSGTLAPLRIDPAVRAALAGVSAEQVQAEFWDAQHAVEYGHGAAAGAGNFGGGGLDYERVRVDLKGVRRLPGSEA